MLRRLKKTSIGGEPGILLENSPSEGRDREHSRHREQLRYSGGKKTPLESKKATWSLREVGWRVQRAGRETKRFQGPN